ncbi:MAG: GFA family protein [Alphaproteobacteria bacterium]|nr:GFA family protein [Alphaproteobacteria bacterium]MBV9152736.1 GFA family protein [Alphaproteobacteria bacterium]
MLFEGGCQCGRIRYRARAPRDRASVCFCRMCQKASGGPFMAFVRFPAEQVEWLTAPSVFASSNRAERGFCQTCGTPLSYRHLGSPFLSVTLNSLDDPALIRPEMAFSPEAAPDWCLALADLASAEMDFSADPQFRNYQR